MIKITLLKIIFITTTLFSQSTMVDVHGTHTLTQTSGMSIYETIDLCLRTAIKNGLVDLVFNENEINNMHFCYFLRYTHVTRFWTPRNQNKSASLTFNALLSKVGKS